MGTNTLIEWAHHTGNIWIGCTEVSDECDECYARTLSEWRGWAEWGNDKPRHETKITLGKFLSWDRAAAATGEKHRVFINSLSDVCDPFAPDAWRQKLIAIAAQTTNLNHLLLTKRPQNFNKMFPAPLPNMWGGTTVGVKKSLSRIKHLQDTPFKVRFLSIEPLLEDLGVIDLDGISWVIVGGESGPKARPMHHAWARSLRDQCLAAGVPFFFKQWGEWATYIPGAVEALWPDGGKFDAPNVGKTANFYRFGKHKSGRQLDGRTWDEIPEVNN